MTKPGGGGSAKPAKPEPTQGCKVPRSLSGCPASTTAKWGDSSGWLCCQALGVGREHRGSKLSSDRRMFTFPSGGPKGSKGSPLCPSCQPEPKGKEGSAGSGDKTRLRINVTPTPEPPSRQRLKRDTVRLHLPS